MTGLCSSPLVYLQTLQVPLLRYRFTIIVLNEWHARYVELPTVNSNYEIHFIILIAQEFRNCILTYPKVERFGHTRPRVLAKMPNCVKPLPKK